MPEAGNGFRSDHYKLRTPEGLGLGVLVSGAVPPENAPIPPLVQAYAELISLAAHEMRTPASVIAGYLRMLQHAETSPLDARQSKMVDEAAKSCARLIALFDELSDVGKLDDGRLMLGQDTLDLFAVAAAAAEGVHEAGDRGVTLAVAGVTGPAPIRGDRKRLMTAFSSLYRAVMREQPVATTIVVERQRSGTSGRAAVIAIARRDDLDEIAALPADAAASRSFDEKRGGMGLALPVARRIIERHGGRLWSPFAHLKDPGKKSAIVVHMPIDPS
jgi:signal transduction histidine kinase